MDLLLASYSELVQEHTTARPLRLRVMGHGPSICVVRDADADANAPICHRYPRRALSRSARNIHSLFKVREYLGFLDV